MEIIHKVGLGDGLVTICGLGIHVHYNGNGIPSYNPKYTIQNQTNCPLCLDVLKKEKERIDKFRAKKDMENSKRIYSRNTNKISNFKINYEFIRK